MTKALLTAAAAVEKAASGIADSESDARAVAIQGAPCKCHYVSVPLRKLHTGLCKKKGLVV